MKSDKGTPFIKLSNVIYTYPRGKKGIKNINLNIYRNQFTGIVGKNGSGKTTLGKLMVGILKPDSGFVEIQGKNTSDMSLGEIGMKIGYLFQNPSCQLFASTVEEELSFILELKGFNEKQIKTMSDEVLEYFELQNLRKSSVYKLSGGEKQRLALAAVLINKPEFLILDEPTKGLDLKRRKSVIDMLSKLLKDGIGMVVISHDDEMLNVLAERMISLSGGEVFEDITF